MSSCLQAISVRSSVSREMESSSLFRVSLDIAVNQMTGGPPALDIEECLCPPQYSGLSCEDCYQVSETLRLWTALRASCCRDTRETTVGSVSTPATRGTDRRKSIKILVTESLPADIRILTVKTDMRILTVKTDMRIRTVKTDTRTLTVKTDMNILTVKTDLLY